MDDASKVLIRALDHAALARWRYCDVEALLDTAPGLEHARTYRPESTRPLRVPRPNPRKVLTEQWAKAVAYAADAPMPDVDDDRGDPEFEARASTVSTAAAAVQQRAGAAPGRWARPGGPSDRRILDALCLLALQAVRLDVEADLRRLALLTGLGRTTVDRALHRLAAEGWLLHHTPGAGVRGARWALPPAPTGAVENSSLASSTTGMFIDGSQAIPRPAGAQESNPRPARAAWLTRLSNRLVLLARDVFTPSGLGHHAARVYEALSVQHRTSPEISEVTGYNIRRVHSLLEDLAHHRLAQPTDANTWRRGTGSCTTSAKALGVHGVLAARQRRYIDERLVWAWWNEEVLWMHQPRKRKYARRRRTPGTGQGALPIGPNLTTRERLGPFPRRLSGRADFPAATAHVRARRRARTTTAVVAAAA